MMHYSHATQAEVTQLLLDDPESEDEDITVEDAPRLPNVSDFGEFVESEADDAAVHNTQELSANIELQQQLVKAQETINELRARVVSYEQELQAMHIVKDVLEGQIHDLTSTEDSARRAEQQQLDIERMLHLYNQQNEAARKREIADMEIECSARIQQVKKHYESQIRELTLSLTSVSATPPPPARPSTSPFSSAISAPAMTAPAVPAPAPTPTPAITPASAPIVPKSAAETPLVPAQTNSAVTQETASGPRDRKKLLASAEGLLRTLRERREAQ